MCAAISNSTSYYIVSNISHVLVLFKAFIFGVSVFEPCVCRPFGLHLCVVIDNQDILIGTWVLIAIISLFEVVVSVLQVHDFLWLKIKFCAFWDARRELLYSRPIVSALTRF